MKRNYWPLLFIGIFSFTFGMIVWTINSAIKVPIQKDETFMSSYHDVDRDYNKIVESNNNFEKKFNFNIKINEKDFGLVYKDMFLGQRVIEEKSLHKNTFKLGNNDIVISVKEKQSKQLIKDIKIKLRLSRPTNHGNTMDFTEENFNTKKGINALNVDLGLKGNWNITGQIIIGNDIGYFYIKSNAI